MRPFFVVNPASANGQTGRRWAEIEALIRREVGDGFGKAFTDSRLHASRLAKQAAREGYDTIVAVGGDGTLNEVVNGLVEGDRPVAPGLAIAILPRGTGGDFCRTLELEAGHPGKALSAGMKNNAGAPRSAGIGTVVRTEQPLVEVAGLEPASSELSTGLLRAQPARRSRTPTDHRPLAGVPAR